jgi:hypothetical protein
MPAYVQLTAAGIVVTAGLFLIALAMFALARPAIARHFFLGFARTAATHYVEMAARIMVGGALVVASPRMLFPQFFYWFGLALLASSAVLLCLPWKWHRSFGERVLPRFVSLLGIVSFVSLLLGGLLVAATVAGAPSNTSLERTRER